MNIYESPAHLPDLDTRIHFAARLRHNSHCHFAADPAADALLADKTDIEIVSGGCSGADALAERYAHSHGYPLQIFPADWSRYGKRAGYVRNREMHAYISTFAERGVIAFWDGTSKGTAQSFALAKEFDNPIRIVRIDPRHGIYGP